MIPFTYTSLFDPLLHVEILIRAALSHNLVVITPNYPNFNRMESQVLSWTDVLHQLLILLISPPSAAKFRLPSILCQLREWFAGKLVWIMCHQTPNNWSVVRSEAVQYLQPFGNCLITSQLYSSNNALSKNSVCLIWVYPFKPAAYLIGQRLHIPNQNGSGSAHAVKMKHSLGKWSFWYKPLQILSACAAVW